VQQRPAELFGDTARHCDVEVPRASVHRCVERLPPTRHHRDEKTRVETAREIGHPPRPRFVHPPAGFLEKTDPLIHGVVELAVRRGRRERRPHAARLDPAVLQTMPFSEPAAPDPLEGAPGAPDRVVHEEGAERFQVERRTKRIRERHRGRARPRHAVPFGRIERIRAKLVARHIDRPIGPVGNRRGKLSLKAVQHVVKIACRAAPRRREIRGDRGPSIERRSGAEAPPGDCDREPLVRGFDQTGVRGLRSGETRDSIAGSALFGRALQALEEAERGARPLEQRSDALRAAAGPGTYQQARHGEPPWENRNAVSRAIMSQRKGIVSLEKSARPAGCPSPSRASSSRIARAAGPAPSRDAG
jgi:hypothetical protein